MILEDVIKFLQNVPPFQFLDGASLADAAKDLSMEFYPKNTVILKQDGPPSDSLRIIKKGGVRISVKSGTGEDVVIDFRGEGDTFGIVSLMSKDRQKTTIIAIDDTICYLLNKDHLYRLIESHPTFTEYLLQSHFTKYIDKTYREMHNKSLFYGSSDHLLFTTQIGDMATKDIIAVCEKATIREAAEEMVRNRISSVIVFNADGQPTGIVTDRDMREKVVARARNVNDPVKDIMSLPLVRVDVKDYCFEAVLRMIKHNIHHILVIKEGALKGVLTNHDLMLLQGSSPLSFAKDLESQQTIEGLIPVSVKINRVVGLLLKEGARASNITKIITELNDRLVRKVLEIAEKQFGQPPVAYCWVSLGSEGRKEQTFKTDQDNAIIYADPEATMQEAEIRRYFAEFTGFVKDGLLRCGFPPCPADYMPTNPKWCQPLRVWKKYISDWVSAPTSDALLNALTFFDFRPLHGENALAEDLRTYLIGALKDQKVFLGHLANMAIKNSPPIGFFKSFVVEKDGEHKNELNLKVKGVAPLVDIIRLFALERGVRETSTLERIAALRASHTIVQEYADEFEHAFEFIMLLRIHHQFSQLSVGGAPDNFINPNKLSNLERRSIKDAFHLITTVQDLIIERYKSLIW
ncbi:MAG: cyclic nucleotide-binding/CBS domain-containing protein [Nitrospirae bacterium]|nr:cyclic nucleotide-binding/CBS domain-containing protein [Nitrospirota bacterium]NTW66274.1 cyclic nucleotide-binding/CBS domain-containing protein [Nitrospirota bacterium]